MRPSPRRAAALCAPALLLLTASCAQSTQASDDDAAPARSGSAGGSLAAAVKKLPVKAPHESGYEREKFHLWVDADHDGCDTRKEVLIRDAVTPPHKGAECRLTGGKWKSFYDGKTVTNQRALDIDHVVPLGEAWASGASTWPAAKRERYANDLGAKTSLVAVSLGPNRAKGDRDPAGWLPPSKNAYCRYTTDWVDTKLRWNLTADKAEKKKLGQLARSCPTAKVNYEPAK